MDLFGWLRKKAPGPKPQPGNPGRGYRLRVGFSNADRSWEEEADLVQCLADTLRSLGHAPAAKAHWLELEGFTLLPQIASFQPAEPSGVQAVTTIEVSHPALAAGVFEYQHSAGDTLVDALSKGFKGWAEFDLPVFLDSLREQPEVCTFLDFQLPATEQRHAELHRRIVLGPPVHVASKAADTAGEEHPFCPCCLYTNSYEAFRALLESEGFYGIRLFAMRGADGIVKADCRVNGEDWPAGVEALVRYGESWPQRGFEFRKQYVCLQTVSAAAGR